MTTNMVHGVNISLEQVAMETNVCKLANKSAIIELKLKLFRWEGAKKRCSCLHPDLEIAE